MATTEITSAKERPFHQDDQEKQTVAAEVDTVHSTSPGVATVEGINATWKTWHRWVFFSAIILVTYARGLDAASRPTFQAMAVSSWNNAGQTATLGVIRACVSAISQPIHAKLADYYSRTFVLIWSTIIFAVGSIIQATATGFSNYIGGYVLYTLGFGAEHILYTVLLSDFTSLRSRLLFAYFPSFQLLINSWVSGTFAEELLANTTWRWGFGWGTIVVPVISVSLWVILLSGERRARSMGVLDGVPTTWQLVKSGQGWANFFWTGDVVGIILLSGMLALVLIPISLGGSVASKWETAKVLAPLVVGVVIMLPAFIVWEAKLAKHPMVPAGILKNRHVLCSMLISMLGCVSIMTQGSYLLYMLLVSFGKSVEAATQVANIAGFVHTIVGIVLGLVVRRVRRVKWSVVAGCCFLIVAYGLLIRYRGGHSKSDFAGIVGGEIVMGIAGGMTTFPAQVGLQAVVKHEHLAIVTALFLTFYQVGAAIGGACAGGIWVNTLPPRLRSGLIAAGLEPAEAAKLAVSVFGNPIAFIKEYPVGSPARNAVEYAYRDVQRFLCILGICIGAVMLLVSFGLDNVHLPDTQEGKDVLATEANEVIPRVPEVKSAQ